MSCIYTRSYFMLLLLFCYMVNVGLTFTVGYYFELVLTVLLCQYMFSFGWLVYNGLVVLLVVVFISVHCRVSVLSVSSLSVLVVDTGLVESVLLGFAVWSCWYSLC